MHWAEVNPGRLGRARRAPQKWQALNTVSASAIVVALSTGIAGVAYAQSAPPAGGQTAQAPGVEEVVVTATRIVRNGYDAPTPTTVISVESIEAAAPTNIADYVNTLPSIQGSTTPQTGNGGSSGGTTGLNALNLRNLGTNRTLVLLDGRRVVPSAASDVVDVSDFPQALVSRVDVVTGGASASWGSDAVAGVINFVLDNNFTGLKGDIQGGVTTYGDDRNDKIALTGGTGFADDRGHFLFSADYAYQQGVGVLPANGSLASPTEQLPRPWYAGWKGYTNPSYTATCGCPDLLIEPEVGLSQAAPGGIITSGPLKNIAFGPGGQPLLLAFNQIAAPVAQGGNWQYTDDGVYSSLDGRLQDDHVFTRLSYDLADNVQIFAEWMYGYAYSRTSTSTENKLASLVISNTNPFIPSSILAQMTSLGLTSITLGSWFADEGPLGTQNHRNTMHETFGVNGSFTAFDKKWTWNAYFEDGLARTNNQAVNESITSNFNLAIQAVRNPTTGAIICASSVKDPGNGCVPFDVFGTGVNSQAALNYITGVPYQDQNIVQHVIAANLNGEAFSTWAGPVSVALGGEYRYLGADGISDPNSVTNNWFSGNFHPIDASYHVQEAYLETVIPLATNQSWAKSLDLDAAVRGTDYSTSGYVKTWKLGSNYAPVDDIRFRAVFSRDIRAPSLVELYSPPKPATQPVVDDAVAGNPSDVALSETEGNTALKPENTYSSTLGAVVQPHFLPGFNASFDYYNIRIHGAIAAFSNQQIVDECYQQNVSAFCPFILRATPGAAASASNPIVAVLLQPINFQTVSTRGFDILGSYNLPLSQVVSSWDGQLVVNTAWTHVIAFTSNSGLPSVPVTQSAGVNSGAVPYWRGTVTLAYNTDRFRVGVTERFISSGVYSHLYVQCTSSCPVSAANGQNGQTINDNYIPGANYTDLALSYKFDAGETSSYEAYFNVNNLTNKSPPVVAGINGLNYIANGTNPTMYDVIGRMFHAGIRFKM